MGPIGTMLGEDRAEEKVVVALAESSVIRAPYSGADRIEHHVRGEWLRGGGGRGVVDPNRV